MREFCKKIAWMVLLGSLIGCTKILEYPADYPGDQLAIIGIISPQSGARVYVTKSISPSGDFEEVEQLYITNAEVKIYQNDQLLGDLSYKGDGLYQDTFGLSIDAGNSYYLRVSHETLGTATSDPVLVPNSLQQLEVNLEFTGKKRPSGKPEAKVEYQFKDEPGPNYYLIMVKPDLPNAYQFQITDLFGSQNFEFCEITNYHPSLGIFMTDVCFEDQISKMGMLIELSGEARLPDREIHPYDRVQFEISSISSEYYQYLLDKKSLETDIGILEPRPTFNNINGGVGVFMAANEEIRRIRF